MGEERAGVREETESPEGGVCVCVCVCERERERERERPQCRVPWILAIGSTPVSSFQPQSLLREGGRERREG